MLRLINQKYFDFEIRTITDRFNNTSEKIVVKTLPYKTSASRASGHNQKDIVYISAPQSCIDDFGECIDDEEIRTVEFDLPMNTRLTYAKTHDGKIDKTSRGAKIDIRFNDYGPDRANIFLLAIPCDGIVEPIEDSPLYRIYKGMLITLAEPIKTKDTTIKKILYLVVSINRGLFSPQHKYHVNSIMLEVVRWVREPFSNPTTYEWRSFQWFVDKDKDFVLQRSQSGMTSIPEIDTNAPIWTTYIYEPKPKENDGESSETAPARVKTPLTPMVGEECKPRSVSKRNHGKHGQRPWHIEGTMIVTTNKHGIRKEIPLNRNYRNGGSDKYDYGDDSKDRGRREKRW